MSYLCNALQLNTSITKLDLYGIKYYKYHLHYFLENRFGDEGIFSLNHVLKSNKYLTHLNIESKFFII